MPTEPAYIRNLKSFTRGNLSLTDLPELEAEMYGGSARATVLMLCAVLETCLTIFLRDRMRPSLNSDDDRRLFDTGGSLRDLSAKTIIGYAFNFFGPETKHDIDLIRLLRNEFAHSRRAFGFSTPQVIEFCTHLKSPDWPGVIIPLGYLNSARPEDLSSYLDKTNPRTRYAMACHNISEHLLQNTQQASIAGVIVPDLR
jgi:hypothetical protein